MVNEIEATLDSTYDALLSGDFGALEDLIIGLQRAVADPSGLSLEIAERIKLKAGRNGRMLEAAAMGLRAAKSRLVEISAVPMLTIYDFRGRKESFRATPLIPSKRF